MKQKFTLKHPLLFVKLSIIVLTLFLSFSIFKPDILQALGCCDYWAYGGDICCGTVKACSHCGTDPSEFSHQCVGTILPFGSTCSY